MELKTVEDINIKAIADYFEEYPDKDVERIITLFKDHQKIEIIKHIKRMRREGRDIYYINIDEKSAIPKLMEIFNLKEEDLDENKI